jgi:phosphate transport system substrate-binding protein
MKRKKVLSLCIALALAAGALAACGNATPSASEAAAASTVRVSGSTSVFPLLDALKDMFMAGHPDIRVQVEQGGSGVGIKNVRDGIVDIGMSSRNLKDEEKPMVETTLCLDGIAVIVHKENPVDDLSAQKIAGIYRGEITNWKDVGGKDAKITLITREPTSGTRGAFEELILDEEKIDDTRCLVQNSTGNAASSVENDPNAIAYISLGVVANYPNLKAVQFDGVKASADNVKNGTYSIARPFLLLTRDEPAGAVKTFLDYVTGDYEARDFIEKEHYILK